MRKKNACILGEIINCLSKKNKKNFEKKEKKHTFASNVSATRDT